MASDHVKVLNTFFEPWLPEEKIAGWCIIGHDETDTYRERVITGPWKADYIPLGWIDWARVPIEIGSPLLSRMED